MKQINPTQALGQRPLTSPAQRAWRVFHRLLEAINQRPWLLLPLLALPSLWVFQAEGLPRSFDGGLHMLRIGQLDDAIRHGMWLPRWLPDQLLGLGYPLFNYYAPATYYLAEALHLAGLSVYAAFIGAFVIKVLVAGFGMYCLAQTIFGERARWSSLAAATAYMLAPYFLINIFVSGNPATAGAQALLPWVLWSMRGLLRSEPAHKATQRFAPWLIASLGGLAVMHHFTLIFAMPVFVSYLLLHWWQAGRSRTQLGWLALALLGAIGVSAFYWLPLLVESGYISDAAREISVTAWMPKAVWTWQNFLNRDFVFPHSFARPVQLGLMQLILAVVGFVLAWRRDREWVFFLAVALLSALVIGQWALPFWLGNPVLSVVQFPWRLLSITSLPLALFAGGVVARVRPPWLHSLAGVALAALILYTNLPHLQWMDMFDPVSVDVSPPVVAQVDVEKGVLEGGEGNSSIQEFRPRWADRTLSLDRATVAPAAPLDFQLHSAGPYGLAATVTAPEATIVRFTTFYFPGWNVSLDDGIALATRPDTNLGLLTVELPAGVHQLQVTWTGTRVQRVATWISQITLLLLLLWGWRHRWSRLWLAFLSLALALSLLGAWRQPVQTPVQAPLQPVEHAGLRLLGYRVEQNSGDHLTLLPYWVTTSAPDASVRLRWQIIDDAGSVVSEVVSRPFYNASSAAQWPVGTLVDDAYRAPLPPTLAAGSYRLALQIEGGEPGANGDTTGMTAPVVVGGIEVHGPIASQPTPDQRSGGRAGGLMELAGYSATANHASLLFNDQRPPVVHPGDALRYTLFWRGLAPIEENLHGFVHLVDVDGAPLAQEDHVPGPFFRPPTLWDSYRLQPDVCLLRLPDDAKSGIYRPAVGVYRFAGQERLPMFAADGAPSGDALLLPPVKIVSQVNVTPQHPLDVRFGDVGQLIGYDLVAPPAGVQPGADFGLTLYFHSLSTTDQELTRFLQVHSGTLGMAAQQDGLPQGGHNPTWSWQPGEIIVDRVDLHVNEAALAGDYRVLAGLYNARDGGVRTTATDGDGNPIPDNAAVVTTISILP